MSNNTNFDELNVTNDDMKEMLAEDATEAKASPAPKKNVFYRILALILAVAPIVCICLLPVKLLIGTTNGYAVYGEKTLLDAFLALFRKDGIAEFYAEAAKTVSNAATSGFDSFKVFGLPVLSGTGTIGKVFGLGLYAIPVVAVLTVVFAIVALFSGKAAPAMTRAIVLLNFWVYAGYAIAVLAVAKYMALDLPLDVVVLAIAGASFLVYLILSFVRAGKKAWMSLLMFLLTIVFAGAIVYGIALCGDNLPALFASEEASKIGSVSKGDFYTYAVLAAVAVGLLASAVSSIRLSAKKGYVFDLIRYIFNFLVAGALIAIAFLETEFKNFQLYAIIAAAVALVQVVLVIIALSVKKKSKKAVAETTEETTTEQEEEVEVTAVPVAKETEQPSGVYMEAVPYEGTLAEAEGPEAEAVSQTKQEEPAPAPAPVPAPTFNFTQEEEKEEESSASSAGYDFYNSRAFDPFIASLNNKEREQFTELFILKYRGETKNLPDYQVGGDNTEFFRKVFIYLGQYREIIPDSLLNKMYQFASRK